MNTNLTLSILDEIAVGAAVQFTPEELLFIQTLLSDADKIQKARKERFMAILLEKYEGNAKELFTSERKDTGTVHIDEGEIDVKAEIGKKVIWDQDVIPAVLDELEEANEGDGGFYCKAKFEVEEKKYKDAPAGVKKLLDKARTIKPEKLKLTLSLKDAAKAAA